MTYQSEPEAAAIQQVVARYFDGLYHSDVKHLQGVLHPAALYATVVDNKLRRLSMEDYWPVVAARISPASQGQARRDKIVAIDILGATTALAKVECAIAGNFYRDLLSLVKLDNRWWIIAKVFQMEEEKPELTDVNN